jgi:abnormal spindle-like microcephaly-associated protein
MADIMQRAMRCYRSRTIVTKLRVERDGAQRKATVKIQSAWRKFKNGLRFTLLREAWEVQQSGEVLRECQEDKEGVDDDIADVKDDTKRIRKCRKHAIHRIRELRDFQWESERRLPEVEAEIEKLTEEDIEKGWAEAFETEWDILTNSLEMSEEEVLGKKIQVREYDDEIVLLELELEDLEVDMDENGTRELEELEYLRSLEIKRGMKRAEEDRIKRVRIQRLRWKVQTNRKKIIERGRKDIKDAELMAAKATPAETVTSISYKKNVKRKKRENRLKQEILRSQEGSIYMSCMKKATFSLSFAFHSMLMQW